MRGKIFYGTMGGGSGSSGSIFLQPASGGPISGTLQQIADNAGNNSALWLSSSAVNIGAGIITNNGVLTVKGAGANLQSWRSSSNVEVAYLSNSGTFQVSGNLISSGNLAVSSGLINFVAVSNGALQMGNASLSDFNRIILGTNNTSGISLVKNSTELRARLGDDSAYAAFRALSFQSEKLSSGSLADSYPFRVGNIGAITGAEFLALGLNRQIAIENNGVICYIPFSTSLIP